MLMAKLYENLKNKDKVITEANVQTINTLHGGVEVVTTNGRAYQSDLLVGADGVYSAIRQEMWRLAEEMQTEESFPRKDWEGKYLSLPTRATADAKVKQKHFATTSAYSAFPVHLIVLRPEL